MGPEYASTVPEDAFKTEHDVYMAYLRRAQPQSLGGPFEQFLRANCTMDLVKVMSSQWSKSVINDAGVYRTISDFQSSNPDPADIRAYCQGFIGTLRRTKDIDLALKTWDEHKFLAKIRKSRSGSQGVEPTLSSGLSPEIEFAHAMAIPHQVYDLDGFPEFSRAIHDFWSANHPLGSKLRRVCNMIKLFIADFVTQRPIPLAGRLLEPYQNTGSAGNIGTSIETFVKYYCHRHNWDDIKMYITPGIMSAYTLFTAIEKNDGQIEIFCNSLLPFFMEHDFENIMWQILYPLFVNRVPVGTGKNRPPLATILTEGCGIDKSKMTTFISPSIAYALTMYFDSGPSPETVAEFCDAMDVYMSPVVTRFSTPEQLTLRLAALNK